MTIRRIAVLSSLVLSLSTTTRAEDAQFDKDEIGLWRAASVNSYYINRERIDPKPIGTHVPLVDRLAQGPNRTPKTRLAKTIATRSFYYLKFVPEIVRNQQLTDELPASWNASRASLMVRSLFGSEPSLKEPRFGDIPGGLVDRIDNLRENKTTLNLAQALLNCLDTAAVSQIESRYREALGNKALPEQASIFIDEIGDDMGVRDPGPNGIKRYLPGTLVRVSHGGKKPLTDVVVVTQTTMKPTSEKQLAGRAFASGFNNLFDNGDVLANGETRAKAADGYIESEQLLASTPQSAIVFIPRFEPGDVLVLPLYGQGAYWHVQEAKSSVYTSSGAILDRVLMRAGPHNDDSDDSPNRPDQPGPEIASPTGPKFAPVYSKKRLELTLDAASDSPASFEVCVPAGKSYLPIGRKETVNIEGPMIAIAQNDATYVALGSPRSTGHGLVLVPADRVKKTDLIDERTDSEKAFDAEAAAHIARNQARARGEEVPKKAQRQIPPRGGPFPKMNARPRTGNRPNAENPPQEPPPNAEPVNSRPAGPTYKIFEGIVNLSLPERSSDESPYRFEACINSGDSYSPTGRQIEVRVRPGKPIRLIAEGSDYYVGRVTNSRTKAIALVLIPKSIGGEIQMPD